LNASAILSPALSSASEVIPPYSLRVVAKFALDREHTIAHATGLSVEQIRRVLAEVAT
jgi:hypothetical protein